MEFFMPVRKPVAGFWHKHCTTAEAMDLKSRSRSTGYILFPRASDFVADA
jgi:hypothetical protein